MSRNQNFGRWPWSYPVEVPATVHCDDGVVMKLKRRYNFGYVGTSRQPDDDMYRECGIPPVTLSVMVSRKCLRDKLRSGEWQLI
jgi:hypothetical protein